MKKTVVYTAIIEGDIGTGYSAYFPDVPGCTTAGDTLEELAINASQALGSHLELSLEYGEALPVSQHISDVASLEPATEVARTLVVAEIVLPELQPAA